MVKMSDEKLDTVESSGESKVIPAGYEDAEEGPEVRLKDGIDLSDIRSGEGAIFEVEDGEIIQEHSSVAKEYFRPDEIFSGTCGHMPGFDSDEEEEEDENDTRSPFEKLAAKMTNVTEDGLVKKRIFKQGVGGSLKEGNVVRIHYQAYKEYGDEPFDSTVMRSQPMKVLLGKGTVIPGLDLGLMTMKKKEHAQFLIGPTYAFGELGCEPRIPRNATLVYNVEVLDAFESAGAEEFFLLDRENRKTLELEKVLKYVKDEINKGNGYMKLDQHYRAAGRYKTCLKILSERGPKDEEEEKLMQKQELRANINLAVANLKMNSLGQVIYFANNALGIEPKNAKGLYLKGKALMKKGDFERAGQVLKSAQQQSAGNKDIAQALKDLEKEMKKFSVVEKKMCQAMFASKGDDKNANEGGGGDGETDQSKKEKLDYINKSLDSSAAMSEFKQCMEEAINCFIENEELLEMPLPSKDFTVKEVAAILEVAEDMGLHHKRVGEGSNAHLYLMKKKPNVPLQ